MNGNYTKTLSDNQKLGFRLIFGRNDFYSSGQIPLDLVNAGLLDRFGYIDPTDGGRVKLGTFSTYYSKIFDNGDTLKIDGVYWSLPVRPLFEFHVLPERSRERRCFPTA